MKLEKLKPGMTVYDVHTYRMGNTTMSSVGVWKVQIISVDLEARSVQASWNSNRVRQYYAQDYEKWREKEPLLVKSGLGYRLANRAEIKAHREKEKEKCQTSE